MVDATHISFRADDRSYYSILKKEIRSRVLELGYSEKKIGEVDIIVSEMTSNLSKHAVDGEILFGVFTGEAEYVEVISIDNGPGMSDPQRMAQDGVSTTNTLGHGIGSIRRLSDNFDLYSQRGWGTIALSRVYKAEMKSKGRFVPDLRALVVAKPGEKVSGDGCYYKTSGDLLKLLVADGLGHGVEANKAVNEAVTAFKACPYNSPVDILQYLHTSIRKTRGIVGTVAVFNFKTRQWQLAGVGNISTKMISALSSRNYMSYNGIIGHNIPNSMKNQEYTVDDFHQIILCSDGLKSRWEPKYPSIGKHDLSVLAAALYKDFARRTDDMSVVIAKIS
ncbi:ATP-binding protein [Arcticibacter sp. MXS-1]|uniref:ATP-binding protein n=1 Tax=Arcticibacter sp. MXS-1 TaxID=3341726 RepID=UPI0035A92F6F